MNYLTKSKSAEGLQYLGENTLDLFAFFPELTFKWLESGTRVNDLGLFYHDVEVTKDSVSKILHWKDYLFSMNDGTWDVISEKEFNTYWEEL